MTALLIHAALGLFCVALFFYFNARLYAGAPGGVRVSALEALYYLIALTSVTVGWYFNVQYVHSYPQQAGWVHFTRLLFTNPAAASAAQDLISANLLLFPLWTIIDGSRRGLRQPWIYFVMSLLTSFGFAMGLYLAVQERALRSSRSAL
jgi:hypothetical protein